MKGIADKNVFSEKAEASIYKLHPKKEHSGQPVFTLAQ